MVKGVTRRVVVVRPERGDIFEQAIFIVKSGNPSGRSPDDVLREACRAAAAYSHSPSRKKKLLAYLRCAFYAAAGGACVGAAWLISALVQHV